MKKIIAITLWAIAITLGIRNYQLRTPGLNIPEPYRSLYEEVLAPVVKVVSPQGTGSGVIISSEAGNTYILTAAHMVGNESPVTVYIYIYEYELPVIDIQSASVVITDTDKDLALLKIKHSRWLSYHSVRLAPRNYTPYLFIPVWTVGCSLGLKARPSEGIITSIGPDASVGINSSPKARHLEISAPILPGNSGGGVFLKNTRQLIGITVWMRTCYGQLVTTMAGIVPVNQIYEFLDNYKAKAKEMSYERT